MYIDKNSIPMAIKFFNKSIKINPKNVKNYNYLGNAYIKLGQYEQAKKIFEKALSLNLDSLRYIDKSILYNDIALMYLHNNQIKKAINFYKLALIYSPNDIDIYDNLIRAYKKIGMDKEAKRLYYHLENIK